MQFCSCLPCYRFVQWDLRLSLVGMSGEFGCIGTVADDVITGRLRRGGVDASYDCRAKITLRLYPSRAIMRSFHCSHSAALSSQITSVFDRNAHFTWS